MLQAVKNKLKQTVSVPWIITQFVDVILKPMQMLVQHNALASMNSNPGHALSKTYCVFQIILLIQGLRFIYSGVLYVILGFESVH